MSLAQRSRRMMLPLGGPCTNQLSDGSQGHWSPIVGSIHQHWRNMCLCSCNDLQLMIDRCCKKFYWSILENEPPNTACHRCSSPVSSSTADVIAYDSACNVDLRTASRPVIWQSASLSAINHNDHLIPIWCLGFLRYHLRLVGSRPRTGFSQTNCNRLTLSSRSRSACGAIQASDPTTLLNREFPA